MGKFETNITVTKGNYNSHFYRIEDAWDGKVLATIEDLEKLREEIDKILNQPTEQKEEKPNG